MEPSTTPVGSDLVIFSDVRPRCSKLAVAGSTAHCVSDYAEFRELALAPAAFVVKSRNEAYAGRMLRQIRRDPDHAVRLLFHDGTVAAADLPLSDGALPKSAQALRESIEQMRARARSMRPKSDDRGPEALLLEYMWLRPGYVLEPLAAWQHPRRYRYPVLEALDRSDSEPDTWLQKLDQAGLLERVALRDRQRECDHCGSAHLSFTDVCPNCRSIEIDQHSALHCFTCGLIAPEERYVRGDQRICPKCGARLRHIGSDYDRPLETNVCGACDHVFVEGDVVARCAICERSMSPTVLRLRKVYSWRLSGLGCLAAQGGAQVRQRPEFDAANYAPYASFVSSLDWALKLSGENPAISFGLVGLHLENLTELNTVLGGARAGQLLDAYADRLRECLADVDVGARADQETIYLLLPNADRRRLAAVRSSVQQLSSQASQDDSIGPHWRLAELILDGAGAQAETAEKLLARMHKTLRGGRRAAPLPV